MSELDQTDRPFTEALLFPARAAAGAEDRGEQTALVLVPGGHGLPAVGWTGPATTGLDAADIARVVDSGDILGSNQGGGPRSVAVLPEVATLWFGRPGLAGHRLGSKPAAGRDWATAFQAAAVSVSDTELVIEAADARAGLGLRTEIQAVAGGALRVRHTLTNDGEQPYVVDQLDVALPFEDTATEILDLTGRWGRERAPQRHPIADGVWLREGRTGRPGFDSPTVLGVGSAGFGFRSGRVWGVHVAWSGNARYVVECQPSGVRTIGGGELLLPGELVLEQGEQYSTPWVMLASSQHGLDGLSAQFHDFARALPAHPAGPRPVVCNVWEAVYFDHDLARLRTLADQAAALGIERFVLDDGWFSSRRSDLSGLGDWVVSAEVWPDGLGPIADYVTELGMQFGLWFEPEMVNRDSELFRAHPDWILSIGDREPLESRNQLLLDLGRPEVRDHLFGQISAVLSDYPVRYVKWDHNRPLADAGSGPRGDAAGAREQTLGFYELLDRLRAAHPGVEWESCASGGGRIDLGVIERVERFWTSDMTDAQARQQIQRWTGQLIAPEYLGAHVAAPVNHQTGRRFSLDFRAATAFFGSFGVEWDITAAGELDRARLAGWIALHKQHRALLHGGRVFRVDSTAAEQWIHGVVSADGEEAIAAYVQLDETVHEPVGFTVPGLDPRRRYRMRALNPNGEQDPDIAPWRGDGITLSGAVLSTVGMPTPQRRPLSITLVHLQAQ